MAAPSNDDYRDDDRSIAGSVGQLLGAVALIAVFAAFVYVLANARICIMDHGTCRPLSALSSPYIRVQ
jgi:hypothetical protein